MKRHLLPLLLLCATLAPAQEADDALKADINECVAQRTARQVRQLQISLRDAFSSPAYLKQLEQALHDWDAVLSRDSHSTLCESTVESLNTEGFESRDVDTAALLARITELLADEGGAQFLSDRQLAALVERVHKGMRPVLRRRERGKERALLEANAERKEVTTLSNGVQMEVLPGKGSLREVNRITTETGLTAQLYNRTTRRILFEELPQSILAVEKEIPAGGAWIFWVPAEVSSAREVAAADTAERRRAALASLLGGKSNRFVTPDEDAEEPGSDAVLQKITVWRDDPDAPIQARPDTRSTAD